MSYSIYKSKKTFFIDNIWICMNVDTIIIEDLETEFLIKCIDLIKNIKIGKILFYENFIKTDTYMKNLQIIELPKLNKKLIKKYYSCHENYSTILKFEEKIKKDSYFSSGSNAIKISDYKKQSNFYKINLIEKYGNPCFNRRYRFSNPISEEDINNWYKSSDLAPIGIKQKEFATLEECNRIYKKSIYQLLTMENIKMNIPIEIIELIGKHDIVPCSYCDKLLDITVFNQDYSSKEHTYNFCHKDPEIGTFASNIYFGHTSCNRIQGGYSEQERIDDGFRLYALQLERSKKKI